jgi:hypothetical protein
VHQFAADSPLEGDGFEPSVPRSGQHFFETSPEPGDDKPARSPELDFDSQAWLFAVFGAILLVGYLSQIAMMLKKNFRIKTKISGARAQLDAAVTPDRADRYAGNRRGTTARKS